MKDLKLKHLKELIEKLTEEDLEKSIDNLEINKDEGYIFIKRVEKEWADKGIKTNKSKYLTADDTEAKELLRKAGLEETEENLDVAKVEIAVNRKSKVRDKIKAVLDEPNKKIRGWKPTPKNKKIKNLTGESKAIPTQSFFNYLCESTKDAFEKMYPDIDEEPKEIIAIDIDMLPSEYYGSAVDILQKFSEDYGLQDYILIPYDMSKQNLKGPTNSKIPFIKL